MAVVGMFVVMGYSYDRLVDILKELRKLNKKDLGLADELSTLDNVTRVEIIDESGRILVRKNLELVQLAVQDNRRTIKVFISSSVPENRKIS